MILLDYLAPEFLKHQNVHKVVLDLQIQHRHLIHHYELY
jgi:hypothetical protein